MPKELNETMPLVGVDILLSAACTAKHIIDWIFDHLEKLKEADKIVKRLLEFTEYMQDELKKIEAYTKGDHLNADTTDNENMRAEAYVESFLFHLRKVKSRLESSEAERNKKGIVNEAKKFLKGRTTVDDLRDIEDELKLAMEKLQLFISMITLKATCESRDSAGHNTDLLNEMSDDIKAQLQRNDSAGIEYPTDPGLKCPSAPHELTITETQNKFTLSWKPCSEEIDKYELCYHESKNRTCFIDGTKSSVTIGAPKVYPCPENLLYTMKIRAIRGDVIGEWSNTVVGQFTKPLPQKPTIKKLLLRSTIAELSVTKPVAICSTESPVTSWQVGYIIDTSTEWSCKDFVMDAGKSDQIFYVNNLEPKRRYTFKVKAMNAEGWSDFSDEISSNTNELPLQLGKPLPPLIEALSHTVVKITVESPEGATFMAPVILWQVTATDLDSYRARKMVRKKIFVPNYTNENSSFNWTDMVPYQHYNFKVMAKNERGWSPSSNAVIAFTGQPLQPIIRPSSLKTNEIIKIRWQHWDEYTRPSYYEISKKTEVDKGKELEVQHKIPGNKLNVIFVNLKDNTTYYFKLRSWNGIYVSEWSEEIPVRTNRVSMLKRFSRSSLPPKVTNVESNCSNASAVVEAAITAKAAELSDQSDDEDRIIIDTVSPSQL